ncbi:MAG: potassium-transporting ATPase subunit KdpC [Vulcanimicrobiaceae bacterium]
MIRQFGTAVRITILSIALLGFAYPLGITAIARLVFPWQADGSYLKVKGRVVGSAIIGQRWTQPQYFHGRPSAAGKEGYDPTATGGTNYGPASKNLVASTKAAIAAVRAENPRAGGMPPMDLVTTSGSGIDPDISPAAAYYQAARVAAARKIPLGTVRALIFAYERHRTIGILGEPRVNVLELNLALDRTLPPR